MWKIYYEGSIVKGEDRLDWDRASITGVQILAVKDPDGPKGMLVDAISGERRVRSRVCYYQKKRDKEIFWDQDFYIWGPDDLPAGCTPDAVLDRWAQETGETDVRVGDLSLDDLHAIGVKCGRSLANEKFEEILQTAINDPEIP